MHFCQWTALHIRKIITRFSLRLKLDIQLLIDTQVILQY